MLNTPSYKLSGQVGGVERVGVRVPDNDMNEWLVVRLHQHQASPIHLQIEQILHQVAEESVVIHRISGLHTRGSSCLRGFSGAVDARTATLKATRKVTYCVNGVMGN